MQCSIIESPSRWPRLARCEITAKINTAELVKQWEERAEQARGIVVETLLGAKTDLGCVRENNEDKFEFFQPDDEDVLATKGSFYARRRRHGRSRGGPDRKRDRAQDRHQRLLCRPLADGRGLPARRRPAGKRPHLRRRPRHLRAQRHGNDHHGAGRKRRGGIHCAGRRQPAAIACAAAVSSSSPTITPGSTSRSSAAP